MNFTENQLRAINLRGHNILVSAAAGSGKTATLTEKIIRLLTDPDSPAQIDRMLIVTFTRAAAGELRTRISKKLSEALALDPFNHHLLHQLTALGSAKICTIDSYYLDLVRSNFQRIDLPANFRLADETELKILRTEIMNSVIERKYDEDDSFAEYSDIISTAKSENKLSETLLDLCDKIMYIPAGTDVLSASAEEYMKDSNDDFFHTVTGEHMRKELADEIKYLLRRTEHLVMLIDLHPEASPYGKAIAADYDYLINLNEMIATSSYAEVRQLVYDYSPLSLGTVRSKNSSDATEEIKSERNDIKKRLLNMRENEFLTDPDDFPYTCIENAKLCLKTKEIIDDYLTAYASEKSVRSICEFSDLRRYALELLVDNRGAPTKIALEEQRKYDHIFVDEYQDTDPVQDLVFKTISNGHNLFFVGDIKQSIYSFRGADPNLFSLYRRSYALNYTSGDDNPNGLSVFMSENFRCSPNIISFTNAVCSYLFRETEGNGHGIGYVSEDDLIASRAAPFSEDKVTLALIDNDSDQGCDENPECKYVIDHINRILNGKYLPNGNKYRPRDIAILTRTKAEAQIFANALAKAGIPHANSTGDDLFENPEVLLMLCLMSASDNPQRDIPLSGALRSPIFGFQLSDLIKVRSGRTDMSLYDALTEYSESEDADDSLKNKVIAAIAKINEYRTQAEAVPVHMFMRYLWKDTNALSFAGSDCESKNRTYIERRRNLQKFYEYARKYEASTFKGLHDFVEYVNGIISQGTKISNEDAVTDNTVQIMTVHKSKGLEFPTVFLVGCSKLPNEQDARKNIVFANTAPPCIAFKISDSSGLAQLDTPHRIVLSNAMLSSSSEEEIRILYVALTRARDNLYIVASGKSGFAEKTLSSAVCGASVGGRFSVLNKSKWIDRILIALSADPLNRSYVIEFPKIHSAEEHEEQSCKNHFNEENVSEIAEKLKHSFNFAYPHKYLSKIPAKVSVSHLYPELLNDSIDEYDSLLKAQNLESHIPRFMGGTVRAADKGTATHLFMQFCDFDKLSPTEASVWEEISRLVSCKFITQDIADLIRTKEIVKFLKTDLFADMRNAKNMYREFRFNIFLPADRFTTLEKTKEYLTDNEILVQGVIDVCYINSHDELILCDYKTDRLSKDAMKDKFAASEELFEKHGEQLSYYSAAIEQIMGRKPDKVYIYSLAFGDALELL